MIQEAILFERFTEGRRVRVIRPIQFTAETTVEAGELGTVALNEPGIGQIHIKLDREHPELADCGNCICIIPPDREVSDAVELVAA